MDYIFLLIVHSKLNDITSNQQIIFAETFPPTCDIAFIASSSSPSNSARPASAGFIGNEISLPILIQKLFSKIRVQILQHNEINLDKPAKPKYQDQIKDNKEFAYQT